MPIYEVTNVLYPKRKSEFSVLVSRETRDVQVIQAPDGDTALRVSFVGLMPIYGDAFEYGDITLREEIDDEWVAVPIDEED